MGTAIDGAGLEATLTVAKIDVDSSLRRGRLRTPNGTLLAARAPNVRGSVTDLHSGVDRLQFQFTRNGNTTVVQAFLSCDQGQQSCQRQVAPNALPALWQVTAHDLAEPFERSDH